MRLLFSYEFQHGCEGSLALLTRFVAAARPVIRDGKGRAAGAFSGEIHCGSVVGRLKAHLTKGSRTMTTGIALM